MAPPIFPQPIKPNRIISDLLSLDETQERFPRTGQKILPDERQTSCVTRAPEEKQRTLTDTLYSLYQNKERRSSFILIPDGFSIILRYTIAILQNTAFMSK